MSNLNDTAATVRNNQPQPAVVDRNRAPTISWITINSPTGRRKCIRIIAFSVLVLFFIALIGTLLAVNLRRKTSTTFRITTIETTTTTITTYHLILKSNCETYLNISIPTAMCHFHAITAADINGDGKIDIIHPDCENDRIHILFNNGNGTFTNSQNYSTGLISSSVAIGDVNNDGKSDIIITNQFSDNVGIFYNMGNDIFTDQQIYPTTSRATCAVLVDLNEDNHLDIIVTISNTDHLDILWNIGNGTFTKPTIYFLGFEPLIITTADVNNDKKLDIIVGISKQVGPSEEYYINILFNIVNGNFTAHTRLKTRDIVYSIAVADINGDHAVDIIVAHYLTNIEIFLNTGNGTFNTKKLIDSKGYIVTKVATGDMNGDNKSDIIFTSAYSNKIVILYNIDNDLSFNCLTSFPAYSAINYLTIADINGDEKLDMIVGTPDGILILSLHCHQYC